jgi:glutamate synthase (NADPH/NADH) large chain
MHYGELPQAQGLYDPQHEKDACGVGFVVHLRGRKSHDIVIKGLQLLCNLEHRGASGSEVNTGDGAGILIQVPDRFLREVAGFPLPALGSYATGIAFLPAGEAAADAAIVSMSSALQCAGCM